MAPTMLVLVFVLAVAVSAALSLAVRHVAARYGAVVPARPDRWHRQPTPTFGGVAIAATTLGLATLTLASSYVQPAWIKGLLVMGSAGALFVVGFVDDRLQLTPLTKLAATLAIGSFLLYGLSLASGTELPWWQTVLLVIWYAGLVHAFNLLDNMDGLAAGVALVATVMLALVFGADLGAATVAVLAVFAGSVGGFLVWNVRPARLFMGDCGSLFLGSMVAGTSLVLLTRPGALFAFDGPIICLVLIVPLLDTSFVLVLRRLAGRGATRGGIDHLSHRLVSLGFSERRAVTVLYLLGLAGGATAWFAYGDGMSRLPAAALFVVAVLLGGVHLARVPVYDGEDFRALQKASFAPFLRDLTFRWHALEMLLDIVLISVVYYLSWRIRFEGQQLDVFLPSFRASLPIVLGCKLLALYMSGAYERMWGSFSIRDLLAIVRGVVLGSIASILVAAYVYRFERFSRAVFIIDAALLTLAILAARGSFRMMGEAATLRNPRARRGLIYGAGSGGQLLVREMRANAGWGLTPVAFLDDDPTKLGRRLMGVPIRGGVDRIDQVLTRYRIDEVVFSTCVIDPAQQEQVRAACARRGIPVRHFKLEIT
jgi:UDP-GlcNAc:undecaprenyl-phosphate GlcNAc-1-phosphate transferase